MTGLSWNNGTVSNKDGANGAGINQFTFEKVTFKNNKEYITPANFEIVTNQPLAPKANANVFTITERHTSQLGDKKADKWTAPITGKYTKIYYVQIGMYKSGWNIWEGTITVDNPGGNDKNQKFEMFKIK